MPRVVALYRYPLKGFTPEECEVLTVLDEGRIAGDRVLGLRFADTEAADDAWSKKTGVVALVNTPGLARLQLRFEEKALDPGSKRIDKIVNLARAIKGASYLCGSGRLHWLFCFLLIGIPSVRATLLGTKRYFPTVTISVVRSALAFSLEE